MKALFQQYRGRDAGQSLVEVAIFLPVIIILLLGVVEVSNLLVTQNRVSAASRAATGFAATNIVGEEWKDTATWSASMVDVARNNVTETLELDTNRWDIWTIKASVNGDASGFDEWIAIHAFGDNSVMTEEQWNNADIQGEVLAALKEKDENLAKSVEVAATVAYHDRHSLLGLNAFNLGPLTRIKGVNVMRVDPEKPYYSCDIFPISIYFKNISLYPENYIGKMVANGEKYDPDAWDYPGNPGNYNDDPYDHSGFPEADGGNELLNATRGDIFEAREQPAPTLGAFGWLSWDGSTASSDLEVSLAYPGNLSMIMPPPAGKVNYDNPRDPFVDSTDPELKDLLPSVGDWVQGATGNMNSMQPLLDSYVSIGRPIQIIVFEEVEGTGSNYNYEIGGFVIVKLLAYKTTASDKRILIEFVDWGTSCTDLESEE